MTKFELKQMIMEALENEKSKDEPKKDFPFKKKSEPKEEPAAKPKEPELKASPEKKEPKLPTPKKKSMWSDDKPTKSPVSKIPSLSEPTSDKKPKTINLKNVNIYDLIKNLEAGPKNEKAYKVYKLIKIAVSLGKPNAGIPADIIAKRRKHIESPIVNLDNEVEETE